jgi:hypothetical protein
MRISHSGGKEAPRVLGYNAVWSDENLQTFRGEYGWGRYTPLQRRSTFNRLYGVLSQKTELFTKIISEGCILLRSLLRLVSGVPSIANIFISYYPFHITTCFGLYRPSTSEIYIAFKNDCVYFT